LEIALGVKMPVAVRGGNLRRTGDRSDRKRF